MSDLNRGRVYRLYWIDESDHIDAAASPIEAACDIEAIQQAEALAQGDRVELWHEARLVLNIDRTMMPGVLH